MNEKTKHRWTKILFWTALITSWLSFSLFSIYRFTLLLWIITLTILFLRKSRLKWLLIGLSAWTIIPTFSFLSGTKDYFTGQATFSYVGTPTLEFFNLDSEYRAWNTTSGCVRFGFEPFTQVPNNIAIKFWTNILGFQKGVFTGIYPNLIETNKLIDRLGRNITVTKTKMNYKFSIDNKNYKINESIQGVMPDYDNLDSAKVAIIKNELIIFRPIFGSEILETYLVDMHTGKIFATYYK